MSKIIFSKNGTVQNGTLGPGTQDKTQTSWWSAHSDPSSFFRPTTLGEGYHCRYFRCNFKVRVIVLDDYSVWVSINGGTIKAKEIRSGGGTYDYGWPKAFLAASLKPISFAAASGDADKYFVKEGNKAGVKVTYSKSGTDSDWDDEGIIGKIFYKQFAIKADGNPGDAYSFPTSWSDYTKKPTVNSTEFPEAETDGLTKGKETTKAALKSAGYTSIGTITKSDKFGEDEDGKYGSIYVSGCCLFNSDPPGDDTGYSKPAEIKIYGLDAIFDYYPWGRHTGNNPTWYSHNRDGGSLKRYNSGWKDVKNEEGNADDSKGFRYSGTSFKVSPITGEE